LEQYNGIIFDLDGTLWDASEASAKGWTAALLSCRILGCDISATDIKGVSGKPFQDCVEALVPRASISSRPDVFVALEAYERSSLEEHGGVAYEGVVEGIPRLAQHYDLFLVSNCQQWYLECFWKQFRLQPFFTDWDCHGASRLSKAMMIEAMVRRHDLAKPIYVGDTGGDKRAADDAEIDFAHVSYGFGHVGGPSVTFSSFGDLVAWLPANA